MSIFDYMFVLLLNWTTVIIDNDVAQCVMLPSTRIKIFLRSFVCSFVDAAFHSIPFRSVLFAYNVMSKMSAYYLPFFENFFLFYFFFVLNEKISVFFYVLGFLHTQYTALMLILMVFMAILAYITNRFILCIHTHHTHNISYFQRILYYFADPYIKIAKQLHLLFGSK